LTTEGIETFPPRFQISDTKADCNDQKQASQLKMHFVLLTDAAATSQQLRITHNNFRLFVCDQCCMRLLAVLSTACSAAAPRRNAEVVGEEKEKN
jgi:hypothetical protein